jgi:putative toxin-antitoxin system antitoxin component (TIGR02293 family)
MNLDDLEARARADGWINQEGFWVGPPDFAQLLAHATSVLGGKALAEAWMAEPAMGLAWQRPMDLLETAEGAEMVSDFLTRIEYGVYC